MEGMAGVVHLHQVMRGMPEYERSCRLMTAEVAGIEGVVVKEALGRQAARSLHPIQACRRIEEGAYRAYADHGNRPLYRPQGPFVLEIDWMNANMADLCAQLPDVERAGGR